MAKFRAIKTMVGNQGEKIATNFLRKQGLKLVEKNYRSPYGEIDIIMLDQTEWVFVEVRYRQSMHFGGGLESVTHVKQRKLIKTAEHYIQSHQKITFDACRFDIIEISGELASPNINWVKDAFHAN